jgi:hypothetical protein
MIRQCGLRLYPTKVVIPVTPFAATSCGRLRWSCAKRGARKALPDASFPPPIRQRGLFSRAREILAKTPRESPSSPFRDVCYRSDQASPSSDRLRPTTATRVS